MGTVGRTLGVHMILATQRPAGVVNDDILANTNMRVALRVQSREDSSNVIDAPDAAAIGRRLGARERQSRLLKFLRAEVQRRRGAPGRDRRMLVLVDGFAALRDEYQDVDGLPLLESFHRSYADGPEVGVHFAMTTTRVKAIPSAIDEVTTQKWLFRLADRYDYSSAGIKPEQMPADVNGRAVPVLTRLQTRIATPGCGARAAVEHIAAPRWPRPTWTRWSPTRPGRRPAHPLQPLDQDAAALAVRDPAAEPNVDMDGDLLSARIPRRAPVVMTAGRGYLCLNGGAASFRRRCRSRGRRPRGADRPSTTAPVESSRCIDS